MNTKPHIVKLEIQWDEATGRLQLFGPLNVALTMALLHRALDDLARSQLAIKHIVPAVVVPTARQ